MSWAEMSPRMQRIARESCTEKQLRTLILRTNGLTLEEIAQRNGTSRQAVHKHLAAAHYRIRTAILEETAT